MGRRPKLKFDEFSEVPPIVVEIISILVEICTEIMGSLIDIWSPLAARASVGLVVAAAAVLQAEAQPAERLVAGTARIHPHQSTHGRIMGTLLAGVKPQGRILGRMLGSIIHRDACGRSKLSYVF